MAIRSGDAYLSKARARECCCLESRLWRADYLLAYLVLVPVVLLQMFVICVGTSAVGPQLVSIIISAMLHSYSIPLYLYTCYCSALKHDSSVWTSGPDVAVAPLSSATSSALRQCEASSRPWHGEWSQSTSPLRLQLSKPRLLY